MQKETPKNLVILGSTGSVGRQALSVVKANPDKFKVYALSANSDLTTLKKQIYQFKPAFACLVQETAAQKLRTALKKEAKAPKTKILSHAQGLEELAALPKADLVLTAIVGSAGILPTLAAIKAKKTIGLANKETLVAAGSVIMPAAQKYGAPIIPVDSEHSALFQCLMGENPENIKNLVLTCSGGPFRTFSRAQIKEATLEKALKHPSWSMGAKITIDSSTLMNKGFEVIEAHWLFNQPYSKIKVLVHPQSIVHSMVEFKDSTLKAQLGLPTMEAPIQLAFSYPERLANRQLKTLPLEKLNQLTFEEPDLTKFPCLKYCYTAGEKGGTYPTALNAADEIAVTAFLQKKIPYIGIEHTIKKILETHRSIKNPTLEAILAVDADIKEKLAQEFKLN